MWLWHTDSHDQDLPVQAKTELLKHAAVLNVTAEPPTCISTNSSALGLMGCVHCRSCEGRTAWPHPKLSGASSRSSDSRGCSLRCRRQVRESLLLHSLLHGHSFDNRLRWQHPLQPHERASVLQKMQHDASAQLNSVTTLDPASTLILRMPCRQSVSSRHHYVLISAV